MNIKKSDMKIRKSDMVLLGIVALSFLTAAYFHSQMPERVAIHWNLRGQADGYMPKTQGLFVMPAVLAGIAALFAVLGRVFSVIQRIKHPETDVEKFRKYCDGLSVLFVIFMFSVHLQIILWNIGIKISPYILIVPPLGVLFFYIGIGLENAKRNWFIGFHWFSFSKTLWTSSDEKAWENANKIAAKLYKLAAVILFIGAFFRKYAVFFVLAGILSAVAAPIVHLYLGYKYKKIKNGTT